MGFVRKNFKFRFLGYWKTWVVTLSLVTVTIIVIVMVSYLLMSNLCKKILNMLKVALVNKRS